MKPRAFTLELTKGCNLRCGYCYYAARDDAYDPSKTMSSEVALGTVDTLLKEGPDSGPLHLHFFGGEPLLAFGRLKEVVLYAQQRGSKEGRTFTFEVTTNGTLFDEDVIRFLNEHDIHVGVSFDGPPEIQDESRPAFAGSSYQRAIGGIRALLESRRGTSLEKKTHCSVVVTPRDGDLMKISTHLEGLGFQKVILTPATDQGGGGHGFSDRDLDGLLGRYDELARDYEQRALDGRDVAVTWYKILMGRLLSGERTTQFCGGGRDYLGVAADGQLALCYRFFEMDEFAMGDLDGVDRSVTKRLDSHSLESRTACSGCWARWFCGGGCHHDNVMASGGLGDPNPVTCDVFRHSMGRTLEMWARLSRAGRLAGRRKPLGEEADMDDKRSFDGNECPQATEGCHVRDLDEEKVVYEPRSHEVVVLNATASWIFNRCDGRTPVSDILESLVSRFDALRVDLEADLHRTLVHLREKSVLM